MSDLQDRQIALLREQVEERDETIRQLRGQLAPSIDDLPSWLPPLTKHQRKFICALHSGRVVTKQMQLDIIYDGSADTPDPAILGAFACQLRKRLAGTPIKIETVWGLGYRLAPESVELLWPSRREVAA